MTEPSRHRSRSIRAVGVTAAISLAALLPAVPAWADGGSGPGAAPTEASLQLQAQELAAQIQADGRQLDKMAEAYNAAVIRGGQLATQVAGLKAESAKTAEQANQVRTALREQAVLSYVVGGAPLVGSVPGDPTQGRNLALSYAEIVSGGQKRALAAYRQVMAAQVAESQQLSAAQHEVAVTLASVSADREAAAQADAARHQALAQVNGQLAVLVAQVQAQQQAAARAAALAREAALTPPSTVRPRTTTPPTTAPVIRSPGGPATTVAPSGSLQGGSSSSGSSSSGSSSSGSSSSGSSSSGSSSSGSPAQAPGASKAIAYANAQLGKPYQWAGAGPDTFDCSGLTMMAWEQAGIYFPHLAQDQYNLTQRIPLASAIPGDLIFFGTPSNVGHVGMYIGNGQMIDAPQTGENVSIQSIYWSDLLGAGRVTTSS